MRVPSRSNRKAVLLRVMRAGLNIPRRRPAHRRRQIAAELFDEIDRNTGMDAALTVQEFGLLLQRYHRSVPHIGVQVQTAAALAPESHEFFRRHIVSRQRQRNDEALPVEGIEQLTAVRVIVRTPDQGAFPHSVAGARCGLFRPIAPAEQITVAHCVVSRVQSLALPAELEQALGHSALIAGIEIDGPPPLCRPADDFDRKGLGIIDETAKALETGVGGEDYGSFVRPTHSGGRYISEFPLSDIHDGSRSKCGSRDYAVRPAGLLVDFLPAAGR